MKVIKQAFLKAHPLFILFITILFFPISEILKIIPLDFGWSLRSFGLLGNLMIGWMMLRYIHRSKDTLSWDKIFSFLLWGGFFLRLSYAFSTGIFLRQHDVSGIGLNENGHYGYILQWVINLSLPTTNAYQFYHPPLFHILSGTLIQIFQILKPEQTYEYYFSGLAILSVTISFATLYVSKKLMGILSLNNAKGLPLMVLLTYHPILILLSGRHNNDGLSYFFIILTLYFFIRWWKKGFHRLDLIGLAFSIGLGMMTKMTVVMVAPIIGVLMLIHSFKMIKSKTPIRGLIMDYIIFALIVFPLGLWYPLRNAILFDQPLNYVFEIPNMQLSVADIPFVQRFFPFDIGAFWERIYANAGQDYNIWVYLIKTSIFGEFSYWGAHLISIMMLMINTGLVLLSILLVGHRLMQWIKKPDSMLGLLFGYLFPLFVAYILFNLRYPFGPTMDFRYLIPSIVIIGYLAVTTVEKLWYRRALVSLFYSISIISVLFFTFLF